MSKNHITIKLINTFNISDNIIHEIAVLYFSSFKTMLKVTLPGCDHLLEKLFNCEKFIEVDRFFQFFLYHKEADIVKQFFTKKSDESLYAYFENIRCIINCLAQRNDLSSVVKRFHYYGALKYLNNVSGLTNEIDQFLKLKFNSEEKFPILQYSIINSMKNKGYFERKIFDTIENDYNYNSFIFHYMIFYYLGTIDNISNEDINAILNKIKSRKEQFPAFSLFLKILKNSIYYKSK